MMFRHKVIASAASAAIVIAAALTPAVAWADAGVAIVPERIIYPGETITPAMLRAVDVINPNLAAGYASQVSEVAGLVTTRTLLPGRTIPVNALREAWTVERGAAVTLVFADKGLVITAPGTPMNNAAIGEVVRARNIDSGIIVSGTVMNDGTIRVLTK